MSDTSTDPEDDQRDPDERGARGREESGANPQEDGKWISVIVALLGLWLLVKTIWTEPAALFWSDLITGVLLVGLGSYNYSRRAAKRVGSFGIATLIVLLGLWLVISPVALGPAIDAAGLAFWNNILIGAISVGLGGYSAYKSTNKPPSLTPR